MLDNALIIMEHLYKTGVVNIRLRRLINEQSHYDIDYSIDKICNQAMRSNDSGGEQRVDSGNNEGIQQEQIKFTLSMADIDDHRRQLTFCTSDLLDNMAHKTLLLTEQLKLLQMVEEVFSIHMKLEISGHPDFQYTEVHYEIHDRYDEIKRILTNMKDKADQYLQEQLKEIIIKRTEHFKSIYHRLICSYDQWIEDLENYRYDNKLLTLFSNRQIMIMIILLTMPTNNNSIKQVFFEKIFLCKGLQYHEEKQSKLAIQCLTHYLQSLRMIDCNLSEQNITHLYERYKIDAGSKTDTNLKVLSNFLGELYENGKELFPQSFVAIENQQYVITLNPTGQHTDGKKRNNDFDRDAYCILLNIFHDRLPADYQILRCSSVSEDDIRLFFLRVQTFHTLTFVVMDIDQMHNRLRTFLWEEQDSLTNRDKPHAPIYYFTRELITGRRGLRPFYTTHMRRNPTETYAQLIKLMQNQNVTLPQIDVVYGTAGIGKTHRIRSLYQESDISCISINDKLNLSSLISTFLSLESNVSSDEPVLYLNISIHAPFDELNRVIFSLLVCGSLNDIASGLTFSSSLRRPWKYVIEVPYTDTCQVSPVKHFEEILPILSIVSSKHLREVTNENYQLFIGEEEELVARFLKAYENRTIDHLAVPSSDDDNEDEEEPVEFDPLTDHNESRQYIYDCLETNVPDLRKNKIFELSYTKFLYRRVRFFTGFYYRYNSSIPNLGSIAMMQMIQEAKYLTQVDFSSDEYHRIYLVYDPHFALHLLHNDWNAVPLSLKILFGNRDPIKEVQSQGKNYFIECLAWLININYNIFEAIMKEMKFILTENFAYKLFHIHERKLTKLPLIIEGETGVGKTFLLKFYSSLLNAHISHGQLHENITPRIRERTSIWLLKKVIENILELDSDFLSVFLKQIKPKLNDFDVNQNDDGDEDKKKNSPYLLIMPEDEDEDEQEEEPREKYSVLTDIKRSLQNHEYDHSLLKTIWKTIVTTADESSKSLSKKLIVALYDFVTSQLKDLPLIEASYQLQKLLEETNIPTVEKSIKIFAEFLVHTRVKPVFYRLLLHPGITEEKIVEFISPICQLATRVPTTELVVFFDEVNTSSCLGSFKEMFMDGTLHGQALPKNIFFTAAVNPAISVDTNSDDYQHEIFQVHRCDYLVHQLPESLKNLKVSYGILDRNTLEDYIKQKISTFTIFSVPYPQTHLHLEQYAQDMLMRSILNAQNFCEKRLDDSIVNVTITSANRVYFILGHNSVSQREIQRCFNLIDFFWQLKYDDNSHEPDAMRCIALSLALIYYFRLPTKEDNSQRKDCNTPSREELGELLDRTLPDFVRTVQDELENFVNTDNFFIPPGVAVNQAIREHIFAIVVTVVTRTPLCIIGAPGQSKTLSFQIVLQNLQGSQLSTTSFCRRLPAVDPFFYLGSKYSRSEDIAYVFDQAIKREQQYRQIRIDRRCVVFFDEASLPDENKMVLKVLHPYLDECQVSFVAIANKSFDAANANRMICVYRSLPSQTDQQVLAYGCLSLPFNENSSQMKSHLDHIVIGLCEGYRKLLVNEDIPKIFHDRDFIYMLRELRFELLTVTSTEDEETSLNGIKPVALLHALEDNFNGISRTQFKSLVNLFFQAIQVKVPNFLLPTGRHNQNIYRDVPTILHESMKLDSRRRRLYGRYKLIIDESEDDSAIHLLLQTGILDSNPNRTTIFRMPDFADDANNELRNVKILSTIKLCMETGKTILMVNTARIHGSLYDVFNQNFSIMATGDTRKIFSKVSIGAKTIDVVVHEDFQCIVHVKRNELHTIPAPFLSRFQKYLLSVNDFYRIRLQKLPKTEQEILKHVEKKAQSFIEHFGRQYFYGFNDNTLHSCLLFLIETKNNREYSLFNMSHHYTQLTIRMKSFIEFGLNLSDPQQHLLRIVLVKLIQLISPESIILKLRTFEEKFAQWLSNLYFREQEHFNLENFLQRLIPNSFTVRMNTDSSFDNQNEREIRQTTKVMIFTRTSSYILSMNQRSKHSLTHSNYHDNKDQTLHAHNKRVKILNLSTIENSTQLQEKFDQFQTDNQKNILIVTINTHLDQQRLHIPYIRHLIDGTEYACNTNSDNERKYFVMLIHSPAQDLYHQSCFPSIFLHHWDFHFFDTCAAGSTFYLQKLLQLLSSPSSSSSSLKHELETKQDNTLCELNVLFEDCLWDFCSRIQILAPNLPKDMFTNLLAYEFYQRQTNTLRRVKCLRQILQQSPELQKLLINIYHQHLLTTKNSLEKIKDFLYQISKDILCGKRFDGLVESIQSQTRHSFINFVSNVFKIILNDYGLETISQLSTNQQIYGGLFYLIDFQSFTIEDDNDIFASQTKQSNIQLTTNYSCIPQTPLFHLFHQRIRSHANTIKLKYIRHNEECKEPDQDLQDDYSSFSYNTTTDRSVNDENQMAPLTFNRFRFELISSIRSDKILVDTMNNDTVHTYSTDLIRTFCAIIENNFDRNPNQYQQTVEFISRWLSLIDDADCQSYENDAQKHLWLLAHVYTTFEYEQTDLFSMYSACRIINCLDSMQSSFVHLFVNQSTTRSDLRAAFFRSIFDHLWTNLCQSSSNKENYQTWIHTYLFISKYYPSEKVLQGIQLVEIRCQIELMNLAYLIFLNEKTFEPQELVTNLLREVQLNARSNCLTLLPKIIEIIYHYIQEKNLQNFTLMIDVQQWVISICKSFTQPSEQVVRSLLTYLNQSTIHISLAMKQFLFNQLIDLLLQMKQTSKSIIDLWDRFDLIPILVECISDVNHCEHYQIPFHPSIGTVDDRKETKVPLFDLYFFYLRAQMKHDSITPNLLNKGMLLRLSKIDKAEKMPMAENLFKQLNNYFLSIMMALLLDRTDLNQDDNDAILRMFSTMVHGLLSVDSSAVHLSHSLQRFLATIISKHSWHYLLNLLQSEKLRGVNENWITTLYRLLQLNETLSQDPHLQLSHQIQFTFSSNGNDSSLFPTLHQPYEELRKIIDTCVQNNTDDDSWEPLVSWIEIQLESRSTLLEINQLKVMLLLNIYYDYYCTNQLGSIRPLIAIIPTLLPLSTEELRVFAVLLDPEQYMIGYQSDDENNSLNDLFKLNCQTEFELSLRHLLVNLMSLILLGGPQSFLWTFAFEPWSLTNTFGFGSNYPSTIQENGVHYDCGCIISEDGDLVQRYDSEYDSVLAVPGVYVAYFSTFGALAWHLLLFEDSVENLHSPILSPTAIGDDEAAYCQAGQSIRAKICHFVCGRLLSTFHFLSLRLNHEDSCILLTRCFERMSFLTVNQHQWIQPLYQRLNDKLEAEEAFQNDVFYYVFDKLAEYKADMNERILQSQIQIDLQQFIDQMPIVLEFQHFQLALHRSSTQLSSSLRLLRFVLDSFDIMKITKLITHLARFYLLLHQTYTQLIKEDEFFEISLKELHARANKRSEQFYDSYDQNEKENHRDIIDHGIEAVNTYHRFTQGLIRPGACDQTKRFETIEFDTPANYLLTTDNAEDGNIVMRILSILVDYHNHVLELLQKELNNNENYSYSVLKHLVNEITSKEVSILQVANYDIGIIALNKDDCEWIERLCQASLTSDEEHAFLNVHSSFTYDFEYVQSQIIRTYLLRCRINYRHIIREYQCYIPSSSAHLTTTDNENLDLDGKYLILLSDEKLENEWNHLKTVSLDNLYHSYTLLKQIAVTLKTYPDTIISSTSLFNFVRSTDQDNDILERMQQYGIKDFLLCHFNHVIKLYAQSINGFEHLFTDVSPVLRIPIDPQLDAQLIEQLEENIVRANNNNDIDQIQARIQTITQLLNDLKSCRDIILQQSSQSFVKICDHLAIENPILEWIPSTIRGESYVPLNIHLVRIRSILQEQKVNIEEKTIVLWQEQTNEQEEPTENPYQPYAYQKYPSKTSESDETNSPSVPSSPSVIEGNEISEPHSWEELLMHLSLFQFDMKLVPCFSLDFLQQLHQYRMEGVSKAIVATQAQKFTISHPDEKTSAFMCRADKFQERLRKIFSDHHYDHDQYILLDKNDILVDFNKNEFHSSQISSLEYRIVEGKHSVCVQFQFRSSTMEYRTTPTNRIATVIKHFLEINQLRDSTSDTYLCFYDQYGAYIEDVSVKDLHENKEKLVIIKVKETTSVNNILCEINLRGEENFHRTVFFYSEVTWQEIDLWLKDLSQANDLSVDDYAFLFPKQQIIFDKNQTISSTIDPKQSSTISVISQQASTFVTLSYENNSQSLQVLKSMKIIALVKNENLRRKLGIVDTGLEDFTMILEKTNDHSTLSKDEMQQSIDTYCSTENEVLHFRLFISRPIIIYRNQEKFSIDLLTKNITIHEVLQLTNKSTNARLRLALKETKRVLNGTEIISDLCGNEFLLVDKKDTCHVCVHSPETITDQYFVNYATIADIYKEQHINLENQYLLYSNEIVPSAATPLTYFLSETPIRFTITETSPPIAVTVTNDQQQKSIQFNCAHSTTVERLCSISCHLLGLNEAAAKLRLTDGVEVDNDLSLMDINETTTNIEFQLVSPPYLSCSITCSDHTIVLPCQSDQLVSSLISEMIEKLSISGDQMDTYELFALDNEETQIDFDVSIEDIKGLFSSSSSSSIIAIELRKIGTNELATNTTS